jgi:hypothetical protein
MPLSVDDDSRLSFTGENIELNDIVVLDPDVGNFESGFIATHCSFLGVQESDTT